MKLTTIASGSRARHGKIIDRAVDRQLADGAARKTERLHHKAVGGHRQPDAANFQCSGVVQAGVG